MLVALNEHPPMNICANPASRPGIETSKSRRHARAVSRSRQGDTNRPPATRWLGEDISLVKTLYRRLRRVGKYPPKEPQVQAWHPGPLTLYTNAEIPKILEGLVSEDEEVFNKASRVIASVANYQISLFHDEIVPLIPSILVIILASPDDLRRCALLDLFRNIGLATPVAFAVLQEHVDPDILVDMLHKGGSRTKEAVIRLLDGMLVYSDPKTRLRLENELMSPFRSHFEAIIRFHHQLNSPSRGTRSIQDTASVVDMLASALCARRSRFGLALLKIGGLEVLLQIATTPTPPEPATFFYFCPQDTAVTDLRIAAISCLERVLFSISKNLIKPMDFPHLFFQKPERRLELQGHILTPLIGLIDDEDLTVSDHVVELLNTGYLSASNPVEIFLWTREGSLERLVRKLALGGGKHNGRGGRGYLPHAGRGASRRWTFLERIVTPAMDTYSQTAWLLQDIFARLPQGVVQAFGAFWEREEDRLRESLIRVLNTEAPAEVRHAALYAGLPLPEKLLNVGPEEEERPEKDQAECTTDLEKIRAMVVEVFMTEL